MKKTYFLQSFLIVLLATVLFLGLKEILPKRIFSEISNANPNIVVDNLMLEALAKEEKTVNGAADIPVATASDSISNASFRANNHKGLVAFFEKLDALEKTGEGEIRIAYFGDSMTDGDYIVQDLRKLFQNEFGGKGVGFVSITSESATSRGSIRHNFSKNWHTQSYVNVKKPLKPFGINGQVSFVKDSLRPTWVEYKASGYRNATELYDPVLYYGSSNNKNAYVELFYNGDTLKVTKPLSTDRRLNKLKLSDRNLKSIKINFVNADSIAFYGINSADNRGVHIDNFSSRGNSGLPLSLFNTSLMQNFDKELSYDLIILHYGTNVLNYGNLNYNWYERAMTRVINQLKNYFQNSNFVVISTADKATKYGTEMKTDSAVVPLARAQYNYAKATESGFINLYELMGGEGSMVKWADEEPSLANKDYTHFNTRGSQKVAQFIYDELKSEYELFKKDKKQSQPKATTKDTEQDYEEH
ncbi:MAG TPA: hypothetical protein VLZ11_06850 [Flavobacterium sp.]|nr:hypothetical protein [Flavobacterium sp.]